MGSYLEVLLEEMVRPGTGVTPVFKVGLIVNPIAGMGGRVGLKGTDGWHIVEEAVRLGARPHAPSRAIEALKRLGALREELEFITYPGDMGENEARACGFAPRVLGRVDLERTLASDTRRAAGDMLECGVDLLLFAGGDGTARDICEVVSESLVVLGIPAGVKMHSAVYASTPARAGDLAVLYLSGRTRTVREAEVMDIDEDAFREGRVAARLYGYMKTPHDRRYIQGLKAGSPVGEAVAHDAIALDVVEGMQDDCLYLVGPGSTTRAIMRRLDLDHTLLGVDVVYQKRLVGKDLNESDLLEMTSGRESRLIVTPVGGQGFLFGRGNQQLSPDVIRRVGRHNIIVVASEEKINGLRGRALMVDTGDAGVDRMLAGYVMVVTGYKRRITYRVAF